MLPVEGSSILQSKSTGQSTGLLCCSTGTASKIIFLTPDVTVERMSTQMTPSLNHFINFSQCSTYLYFHIIFLTKYWKKVKAIAFKTEGFRSPGITTGEEEQTVRKMILVSLWCIQINPSDRPSMSKVIEMLEGSLQTMEIPPKIFLASPARSHHSGTTSSSQ